MRSSRRRRREMRRDEMFVSGAALVAKRLGAFIGEPAAAAAADHSATPIAR